ncbi:MAG: biosynthetic arginine decarboxylase [Candidatus Thiodiazotropha sp. (ex Lucinoma borealis)]|nr:biosynthetic arginine decarboxylase [Candidatus Thiodiazotropha sp. (ex Lucinoma borealis)]
MSDAVWDRDAANSLYQVDGWGAGYFSINQQGHVEAITDGTRGIDLKQLCDELASRGLRPPLLLRFSDMLKQRMSQIHKRFTIACEEAEYTGRYYGVYPIKVNQQRQVVEEIVEFGTSYNWGLEAGSKPELHATLAMLEDVEGLIICNGYKDQEFIDLALMGLKMGKQLFVVVEKPDELELILNAAERLDVEPLIGLRCRLASTSEGLWDDSGGDNSKFGLTASELLGAINKLKQVKKLDCLRLLHFHIGSQVPQIRRIKEAMQEAAHYFVEARRLGAPIEFMDVGGGLGVNYDGSIAASTASVDYSLQEYANGIVWAMKNICDEESLPYPHIISESGRALVAHHAVLIVDVTGISRRTTEGPPVEPAQSSPTQLRQLWETLAEFDRISPREALHDVTAYRDDINKLFSLGHASLADRAHGDDLYWRLISRIMTSLDKEEMDQLVPGLATQIADRYYCNFSVFQSLPDTWAIKQVFPVMPIHRLDEEPTRQGILVDMTCDSDGKIQQFPLAEGRSLTLPLHAEVPGDPYFLGIFLTGAYQEILGDLHNLFGDTHAVHIRMDGDHYELEQVVEGESVAEVLNYVQFHEKVLIDRLRRQLQDARAKGRITAREANSFLRFYQAGLKGYTYLEEETPVVLGSVHPQTPLNHLHYAEKS